MNLNWWRALTPLGKTCFVLLYAVAIGLVVTGLVWGM